MATATVKLHCSICQKATRTFMCDGCLQRFCDTDLKEHLQLLGVKLNELENEYDQFRQLFINRKYELEKYPLIEQINQWEQESIEKIKQKAEEYRQKLTEYTNTKLLQTDNDLNQFAIQIKDTRQENQFNDIDLKKFERQLKALKNDFHFSTKITIKQQSATVINHISLIIPPIKDAKWKQNGSTVAGGNNQGNRYDQLNTPAGIFIDHDQTIYIADRDNHRIVRWKINAKSAQVVAGGNGQGNKLNQLNGPISMAIDKETNACIIADRGNRRVMQWWCQNNTTNGEVLISNIDCCYLTIDKDGSLYVSDSVKNEVKRWKRGEQEGTIIAGGNGQGDQLNQFYFPTSVFVDDEYSLYVSDRDNHRVMKWVKDAKEGIVVAGGNGVGDGLSQLSQPEGLYVDGFGQIYVADTINNRVVRWREGEEEGKTVVGGNGAGKESNQFSLPPCLSFDEEGSLYVADLGNHRIQKFEADVD